MGASQKIQSRPQPKTHTYRSFYTLDGRHPLQKVVPEMCLMYEARKRPGAEIAYFNFNLAREMGLIPAKHPDQLNPELRKTLIDTFSLVIINEYDIENKKVFPKESIKPHKYMATRYLQLQHPNKTGKTSGDGRSIWNGSYTHKGKTWDISSCGTGATSLSPAVAHHKKNFETGDSSVSYGCGLADYPDALAAALLSEIFHKNKIPTERTLAILRFKDGTSINVRVGENLLRPAHMFRYLKDGDLKNLKALTDYYIDREKSNQEWQATSNNGDPYSQLLEIFCHDFAYSAALFEREYIFCWLDWDGDNILASKAAILDYGSVRQFGLFHKAYRYDDVERWSTTLLEQKSKARYLVQTFAQMIDYIKTGEKKNLKHFSQDKALNDFEKHFQHYKLKLLLKNIGCSDKQQDFLLSKQNKKVRHFQILFEHFERAQSSKGTYSVEDGITSDAVFCMRDILREIPRLYLAKDALIQDSTFIEIAQSSYANQDDIALSYSRKRNILNFQKSYRALVKILSEFEQRTSNRILLEMTMRSSLINRPDRITGNGVVRVASYLSKSKPSSSCKNINQVLPDFIQHQAHGPELSPSTHAAKSNPTLRQLLRIVRNSREEI